MSVHFTDLMHIARSYYTPKGGLPGQSTRMDERAVFTDAYAFIPASTMTDIVTSLLPFWDKTRAWVLARPLSGFAETFSQYILEVSPGGGSEKPEPDTSAEGVLFVVDGMIELNLAGNVHRLEPGAFAFIAPGTIWSIQNSSSQTCTFHWIRKQYDKVDGIETPSSFVTADEAVSPVAMPDTNGKWATSRFVDPGDIRHDLHVNIVTFMPGGVIPFPETHVMEHGLYVLQGKGAYKLNQDWIEVQAGDFMWLRAFCPQACYAGGDEPFRYLLYKDVNRHAKLGTFVR